MTIYAQIAGDWSVIAADWGESVTYNGATITAVYEDWNDRMVGNSFSPAGQVTLAWFYFPASSVADPVNGDKIVRAGRTWRVERLLETIGGVHKVQASIGEGVWA